MTRASMTLERIATITKWCQRERYEVDGFPTDYRERRLAELAVIEAAVNLHCVFAFPDCDQRLNPIFHALVGLAEGHKTASVYSRYAIVSEADVKSAGEKLGRMMEAARLPEKGSGEEMKH